MSPPSKSVQLRWAERELFFWTIQQTLKIVVLTALTVYFLISLIQGEPAGMQTLLEVASAQFR